MKRRPLFLVLTLTLIVAVLSSACGGDSDAAEGVAGRTINVVTTTGMVADVVKNVGGDRVDVEALMGPGIDPHTFKASAGDVAKLDDADIIFYNGLELEGRMTDIFVSMASSKPTIAVASEVPEDQLREPPEFEGKFDPHIWFDVSLWIPVVHVVERELSELDPGSADTYKENADAYVAELETLDAWVQEQIATIPEQSRVLITAHDAFGYMGSRYGLDVRALQGISTASEAGAADVQQLADFIADGQIPAIFVESSVPRETIEAVQEAVRSRGFEVEIGGELFSDALGEEGTDEGTYIGMVRHNVETIVSALTAE